MKRFLYMVRWQLSGLVILPFVLLSGPTVGVVLGNFIGALVFWYVDKWLTK